jgi:hypothetical protein
MNWPRLKSLHAGRLARSVLLLAVAGATIGGSTLLAAGAAEAAVGTQPGTLVLTPGGSTASPTSTSPTWSTTVGCPTGFQSSAVVKEAHADGTSSSASVFVNSATVPLTGPIPAQPLQGTMAQIQSFGAIPNGGTQELYVICYSGNSGTGNAQPYMDLFVTYSADGSTYTTSATAPSGPLSTTTTLTAQPNPAQVNASVTLTASESASDNSHPAGSVQFQAGGTAIGSPVAVDSSGSATTTTTFAAAGTVALSAVFTPTNTSGFSGSTGTYSETVTTTNPNSGTEPLAVTVPATGAFTLTVGAGTVTLTSNSAGTSAAGTLNPITVSDTRNTSPGWSVSGQTSDFTGSGTAAGKTISGNQLGWVPTDTSLATGATLGGTVTPAAPGLGSTAAVLAQAHAGNGVGTSGLGANLTLLIPAGTAAGPYAATLTVTAVTSLP